MQTRLRKLLFVPWQITRLWRALSAWGEGDWSRVITLLQPVAERGLDTNTDRLILGLAHTRLGQWEQALWYFEQVSGKLWFESERMIHCNTFAYVLTRADRFLEAQEQVRRFDRSGWPKDQREWGDQLLEISDAGFEPPEDNVPRPQIFH